MRMGQGVRTAGFGHAGITCVLQTQFSSYYCYYYFYNYYYFVDRQLNVVMPGSHIPEHVSRVSCIPPASAYRK